MTSILFVVSPFFTFVIVYLVQKFTYWRNRRVPHLKVNFLLGHIMKLQSLHMSEYIQEIYSNFKGKTSLAGAYIFTKPVLVVLNLDLVKTILIKDFSKFTDRTTLRNEKNEPLLGHLFSMHGEKWKPMRAKLTPTFTSGKMKFMFATILQVGSEFKKAMESIIDASVDGELEIHDIMARFTTDVIGTCAFGIECNSLKDPNAEFRRHGRVLFNQPDIPVLWRLFRSNFSKYLPIFRVRLIPIEITNFIMRIVRETVTMREKNDIKRNDFINLLIEMKNEKDANGQDGLTIDQIAAQVFIFFGAGFETSSSNLSYGLFELARNQEIQDKLRREICSVLEKHDGKLTYEAMLDMPYLEQVISETLRKYPALSILTRVANENYTFPGTDITIEKGNSVFIPVKEIHYDPEYYPDPKVFNPDRFSPKQTELRHPQAFLGFGDGPRNCIGLRFGKMQVRIGLITLLKSFRFSIGSKTPKELKISPHSFVLIPKDGVYLKVEKI